MEYGEPGTYSMWRRGRTLCVGSSHHWRDLKLRLIANLRGEEREGASQYLGHTISFSYAVP
ncbi:hypothetical protein JZ751_023175 [Albula glossodonta]|uniref:Uncharacterized protein n=1 Tax=Albula glossodonta TaxID=121402 RepID=A0A8T2PHG1_9TELE|nr:hypothetical protein JZ751_023175 [Albula glossodonta]